MGFAYEVVPAVRVGADDPLVTEQDRYPGGVEIIDGNESLLEVAGEPGYIPDEEQVISARSRGLGHGPKLGRLVHRAPRRGTLPGKPGIEEAIAFDDPVLEFALGIGSPVVVLARGRLADPAGHPESCYLVGGAW